MKNKLLFVLLTIAAIITFCKSINQTAGGYKSKIYLALQTNSSEATQLSEEILDTLSHQTENRWIAVDLFVKDKVQNLYSAATSSDLESLSEQIKPTPSSDQALIQSINRVKDEVEQNQQQNVYSFIVSQGTTNPATLSEIRHISQVLAQSHSTKMHITIIGISPTNRLPMSDAFASLRGRVQFASAIDEEWQQLFDDIN
jgi:hypothetical protein